MPGGRKKTFSQAIAAGFEVQSFGRSSKILALPHFSFLGFVLCQAIC